MNYTQKYRFYLIENTLVVNYHEDFFNCLMYRGVTKQNT